MYYQIFISDFINLNPSLFTAFVREKNGSYRCVIECEGKFHFSTVDQLISEGYAFIYLKIEDKERYLSFCAKMARKAIESIEAI